ncbi:MAG TPA: hypothetical protein VHI93_05880 [Candidatus Thermoplasmatota archaeon]|nr:hypothetical protein [Candidatus Thermoplasmatota archaeon]
MNLALLVSSLVLAASTATAGLLAAPSLPLSTPQDGEAGPTVGLGPDCLGVCDGEGNKTSACLGFCHGGEANGTAPDNSTAPPSDEPAEPQADGPVEAETCGVAIDEHRSVQGPTQGAWSWMVGSGTRNLTVELWVGGVWTPFGGGTHALLTDGDGNVVASADGDGSAGLPFGGTVISYQADAGSGLSRGTWHLEVEADGMLGDISLHVHGTC